MKRILRIAMDIEAEYIDEDLLEQVLEDISRKFNPTHNKTSAISSAGYSWELAGNVKLLECKDIVESNS